MTKTFKSLTMLGVASVFICASALCGCKKEPETIPCISSDRKMLKLELNNVKFLCLQISFILGIHLLPHVTYFFFL